MRKRLKRLLPYLKPYKGLALLSLAFALLSTLSRLAIPYLAGKAINSFISGEFVDIGPYLIAMVAFLVIGALFRYFFDLFTSLVGAKLVHKMREDLFKASTEAAISSIDKTPKGDRLLTLTSDVEKIQNGLVGGFAALYEGVVSIAITLVFMAAIHYLLAVAVVVLTPISMIISRAISRYNSKHFKAQAAANGKLNAFSLEELTNASAIKTLGLREERKEEFESLNSSLREHTYKANMGASLINPSTRLVNGLINATVILLGAFFIIKDLNPMLGISSFLAGDLSAFLTYAANYMQPFNEISDVMADIDYAIASFERVDQGIHEEPEIDAGAKKPEGEIKDLAARDVTFSYDGKRAVIEGFDFAFPKGERIALVGPTGCGKSTLINLLLRFYDPNKGSFYVDGVSIEDLEKEAYRSHIGMVLQDTWIFQGTVFENIAYAKDGATLEEVREAARKARCDDLIERLPQGYDTVISDSSGLSVGEKQLLCVARVLLLSPEIVILDEATSNIDLRTEKLLNESFKELMEGRTSLVVAHRLSTIVASDVILVMKDGRIIERGSHQELLMKKGFYASLYEAQFS